MEHLSEVRSDLIGQDNLTTCSTPERQFDWSITQEITSSNHMLHTRGAIRLVNYSRDHMITSTGESIPIRLFLAGYDLTPTMRDINKKFSVRYYLNLVLVDEEERRYFKQQVSKL